MATRTGIPALGRMLLAQAFPARHNRLTLERAAIFRLLLEPARDQAAIEA